jgi:hypothetical protein
MILAAARARLADPRRHSHCNSLILGGTRHEQDNHRDKCYQQHNFHDISPSSLLGAAARRELQRFCE